MFSNLFSVRFFKHKNTFPNKICKFIGLNKNKTTNLYHIWCTLVINRYINECIKYVDPSPGTAYNNYLSDFVFKIIYILQAHARMTQPTKRRHGAAWKINCGSVNACWAIWSPPNCPPNKGRTAPQIITRRLSFSQIKPICCGVRHDRTERRTICLDKFAEIVSQSKRVG